jgi:HrpA-like RNA helicase
MSATGNFGKLEAQFADFHPATITSLGKPQPLEIYYTAKVESSIEVAIWRLVRQIIVYDAARLPTGNILIFLPGEKEIHQVVDMLRFLPREFPVQAGNLQILKLYRDLNEVEASLVLKDKFDQNGNKMRKIVVATNIAETSVTFKDLDYVISSGENRTKAYQPRHNASVMVKSPCSQSQMLQQFGRAGRQRPGMAIGLLTEEEFEKSPKHPEPPIRQIDLTSTILTLVTMGVKDIANFSWTGESIAASVANAFRRTSSRTDCPGNVQSDRPWHDRVVCRWSQGYCSGQTSRKGRYGT